MTSSVFRASASAGDAFGQGTGGVEAPRDGVREELNRSRHVPDVVGQATCSRGRPSVPASFGLNSGRCPAAQRRRGHEIAAEPIGNGFQIYHPFGGGGGDTERNRNPSTGSGVREGASGGGCSLCQFRNQSNAVERIVARDHGNEGGGDGRRERQRRPGEVGMMAGEWRIVAPAADAYRLPLVEEQRARTNNRPDIASDPNENQLGGRPLPGNRVVSSFNTPVLPDILNSHRVPPPYDQVTTQPPDSPESAATRGHREVTRTVGRPTRPLSVIAHLDGAERKGCCRCCSCSRQFCIRCCVAMTTFRWLLVSLGVLGAGCIVAGVVLGILQMMASGSYMLHSIIFIGLGVFLLIVIVVGWRCTPTGREPCHLLFNFADDGIIPETRTRNIHRRQRCRNDPHQWFGGVLYPEFRNRCPPPTYNASAQDYQHHLLMAQIQLAAAAAATMHNTEYIGLPTSPPPTYRSRTATLQRPPVDPSSLPRPNDPLPMMAAPPGGVGGGEARFPTAVQPPPPPCYNNNRPPIGIVVGGGTGAEQANGAAKTASRFPETEVVCDRCNNIAAAPPPPEVGGRDGSSIAIGGGAGVRLRATGEACAEAANDPLLLHWSVVRMGGGDTKRWAADAGDAEGRANGRQNESAA